MHVNVRKDQRAAPDALAASPATVGHQIKIARLVRRARRPRRQRALICPLHIARISTCPDRHKEVLRRDHDGLRSRSAGNDRRILRGIQLPVVDRAAITGAGDQVLTERVQRPLGRFNQHRLTVAGGAVEPDTVGARPVTTTIDRIRATCRKRSRLKQPVCAILKQPVAASFQRQVRVGCDLVQDTRNRHHIKAGMGADRSPCLIGIIPPRQDRARNAGHMINAICVLLDVGRVGPVDRITVDPLHGIAVRPRQFKHISRRGRELAPATDRAEPVGIPADEAGIPVAVL